MSQEEIIQLLDRYLAGTATIPEQERVEAWLDSNEDLNNDWQRMDEVQKNQFITSLYQRIQNSIGEEGRKERKGHAKYATIVPMRRRWVKWIAAASIILILAVVGVLTNNHNNNKPDVAVATDVKPPNNTRAVITLANGSKVYLDSAGNGILAQETNVNIVRNAQGEILYLSPAGGGGLNDSSNNKRPGVDFNTIFNPRGSKVISLTLSDGTKVWLNSESSLRYPASFAPSAVNRTVEITGEAYFEVAHNASKPFHVKKGETDITVLGTHFNVNAYDDEESLKVTLLEGSVRVTAADAANAAVKLKPGQQAVINNPANPLIQKILVQDNVDLEATMAWKNGRFQFEGESLEQVMKQIARWYDVEVVYQSKPKEQHFRGGISRDVEASKVFKMLEEMGVVKFEIKGKQVVIKSP